MLQLRRLPLFQREVFQIALVSRPYYSTSTTATTMSFNSPPIHTAGIAIVISSPVATAATPCQPIYLFSVAASTQTQVLLQGSSIFPSLPSALHLSTLPYTHLE